MAWNEQYARILEQMKKNSVTNSVITGANTVNEEPDCLFYTNFSRETAIAFFEVFERFRDYYKANPSIAIDRLRMNLKIQIDGMRNVCPIEVLLYASRIIREQLGNRAVKQALISAIVPYISDNLKSVQYILSGWEWPQILSIVIEACGKTNNEDAIKVAMNYCSKIATKFVDKNDNELLKSYITMIENTQNEEYLGYITEIVTLPQFEEDTVLTDYLIHELRRNRFLIENREVIAETLHAKVSNFYLKRSLERIMDKRNSSLGTNVFSMGGLNVERKSKQVENMDFSKNTSAMLSDFERSRENDSEIIRMTCKKILADIPAMRASDKNLAMILIGTKGGRIGAEELTGDIKKMQAYYPELAVTSAITMCELNSGKYSLDEAMNLVITDSEIDTWYWSVSKYFRFRKMYFEKNLMRAFKEKLDTAEAAEIAHLFARLGRLIELFNGNNELLSTQVQAQNNIMELLVEALDKPLTESACVQLLYVLEIMMAFQTNEVLNLLDKLKVVAEAQKYDKIKLRANNLIKKGDLAREPD
ncbi:MAG: hypothetical protein IJX63_08450 [Lachnospiraceae bacterium]|nr:hypothetical protein [Lachnospiraceae bacterium]